MRVALVCAHMRQQWPFVTAAHESKRTGVRIRVLQRDPEVKAADVAREMPQVRQILMPWCFGAAVRHLVNGVVEEVVGLAPEYKRREVAAFLEYRALFQLRHQQRRP